jgi:hypothetical protein
MASLSAPPQGQVLVAAVGVPPNSFVATASSPAHQPVPSRFNLYAYSFIRGGTAAGGVGSGQYGGSQSGFVASYALVRFDSAPSTTKLALLARGAIAHGNPAERELAAGLRWQPIARVPITLTAERRFRNARSDAFAAYVAGGTSADLPLKIQLDSFAQIGVVSGKDGGPFFDFSARTQRKFATVGAAPVSGGVGAWGGGQKGIFRIDAGPTIGTDISVAGTTLRVNADWRFRIAGDARPASGPALTLSTSF